AHLARHILSELFFAFDQNLAEAVEYFGALRRGGGPPFREGFARGVDGGVDVFGGWSPEEAGGGAAVGPGAGFPHRAGFRFDPAAAHVVFLWFPFNPRFFV